MTQKLKSLGRGLGSLIPNKVNHGNTTLSADTLSSRRDAPQSVSTGENIDSQDRRQPVLSATNDSSIDNAKTMHVIEVEIEKIAANPYQPRNTFDHNSLEELIRSIKEHGILQPLVVSKIEDDKYELIAGERRLRAASLAEFKTVPVIIRKANNQQKLELALIENIQRKDLNPIEEAVSYKKLIAEFNLTQDEISKKVGKSLGVIANALRLLSLPSEIQNALVEGRIDKTAGRTIAGLESEQEQLNLFRELLERGINIRQLENYVKRKKISRGKSIPVFDADTQEKKDMLQSMLGTKVSIDKKNGKGKIMIEFYSEEELASIVHKICKE
ncbi:MAG: ParB/RepB/Spo0J family partition protein [bacterium]